MDESLLRTETPPFTTQLSKLTANVSQAVETATEHLSAAVKLDPREAAKRVSSPDLIAMQMNPTTRDKAITATHDAIKTNDPEGLKPTKIEQQTPQKTQKTVQSLLRLLNMAASGKTWIIGEQRELGSKQPVVLNAIELHRLVDRIGATFLSPDIDLSTFTQLCLNPITDSKTSPVDRMMHFDALRSFLKLFYYYPTLESKGKREAIEYTLAVLAQTPELEVADGTTSNTEAARLAALPPSERQALQIKAVALLAEGNYVTHRSVIDRFFSDPQQPLESKHDVLEQLQFHTLGSTHAGAELFQRLVAADYPTSLLKNLLQQIREGSTTPLSTKEADFILGKMVVTVPATGFGGKDILESNPPNQRMVSESEMRKSIKQTLLTAPYRSRDLAATALTEMASAEQAMDLKDSLGSLLRSHNTSFAAKLSPVMLEVMAEQIPLWLKTDATNQREASDRKPTLNPEDLQMLLIDLKQGWTELIGNLKDNTLSPQVYAYNHLTEKLQEVLSQIPTEKLNPDLITTVVPADLLATDVEL